MTTIRGRDQKEKGEVNKKINKSYIIIVFYCFCRQFLAGKKNKDDNIYKFGCN